MVLERDFVRSLFHWFIHTSIVLLLVVFLRVASRFLRHNCFFLCDASPSSDSASNLGFHDDADRSGCPKEQAPPYLEDHPSGCRWLGSPPFVSHEWPFGSGLTTPVSGTDLLTMGINHLLNGMILQVECHQSPPGL